MEIILWWLLFFVLIILTVIVFVRNLFTRMNQQTIKRIELLEAQVNELESKLNK